MRDLAPRPLTPSAFAPFGAVLDKRTAAQSFPINEGTTMRHHRLGDAAVETDAAGEAVISVFSASRRGLPFEIKMLERHPLGSQAFFPLTPHDWLVVVAENMDTDKDNAPDPASLQCFMAGGGQGVQYATNIWHHPLLVLAPEQDFLIIDRDGPNAADNLVEYFFETPPARIIAKPHGG